jgi:hypothetical protein
MKKIRIITLVAITAMMVSFKISDSNVWLTDKDHSKLSFTISHLMV